jgi:hypothetical protein
LELEHQRSAIKPLRALCKVSSRYNVAASSSASRTGRPRARLMCSDRYPAVESVQSTLHGTSHSWHNHPQHIDLQAAKVLKVRHRMPPMARGAQCGPQWQRSPHLKRSSSSSRSGRLSLCREGGELHEESAARRGRNSLSSWLSPGEVDCLPWVEDRLAPDSALGVSDKERLLKVGYSGGDSWEYCKLWVRAVSADRLVSRPKSAEEASVPVPYQARAGVVGFGPKPRVLAQVPVCVIVMNRVMGSWSYRMVVTQYVDRLPASMGVLGRYIYVCFESPGGIRLRSLLKPQEFKPFFTQRTSVSHIW